MLSPTGAAHLPQDRIVREKPENIRIGKLNFFIHEAMQWLTDVSLLLSDRLLEETAASADFGQAKILVVDDNTDMREYVMRIISQNQHDGECRLG